MRDSGKTKSRTGNVPQPQSAIVQARHELDEAERLRQAKKLQRARAVCSSLLKRQPDYVGATYTMGLILADMQDYRGALGYLVQAAMENPRDWRVQTALAGVYVRLEATEMAARTLEQAIALRPDDPAILITLGEILREDEEYEQAAAAFRHALAVEPDIREGLIGLGLCLNHLGEPAEAGACFEKVLARSEPNLALFYNLSQLPSSVTSIDLLDLMDRYEAGLGGTSPEDKASLLLTRAAALQKKGAHEKAWALMVQGNELLAPLREADYLANKAHRDNFISLAEKTPAGKIRKREPDPDSPLSLFILGTSRSGKTTVEKIVGHIPGIKRGYESAILENAVANTFQFAGYLTRRQFVQLPPDLNDICRRYYLDDIRRRSEGSAVLTNTLPGRIEDVGRIYSEIPNAKFVFVKRNTEDAALRLFMRNYRKGNYYAYRLDNIFEYMNWYRALIDKYQELFTDDCITVAYESVIEDPAAIARQVADLCGLNADGVALALPGDDRNCSAPYREFMAEALRQPD